MASVKLVNGNVHHHPHSLYSHHHHPFLLHHHPLVTTLPPPPSTSPSGHNMTLDYSLPNRSRLGDADPCDLTTSSIGEHGSDTSRPDSHQSYSEHNGNNSSNSPRPTSIPSSTGSDIPDLQGTAETPTKKNKRKLSEPRKLSDIGGVQPVSKVDSSGETIDSCSDDSEEEIHQAEIKIPKLLPQGRVSSSISNSSKYSVPDSGRKPRPLSSKLKSNSASSRKKKSLLPSTNHEPPPSSSTTPSSVPSSSPPPSSSIPATTTQSDNVKSHDAKSSSSSNPPSLANGIPPQFLHPFLSAVPPAAAFGLVPGLYFGGQPYPPAALPASFPAIPLHLQQSYFAAAAAAAAAQSAGAAAAGTSSTQSHPQLCENLESSPFYKHRDSPSHPPPVILQPPQIHNALLSHKPPPSATGSGPSSSVSRSSQPPLPSSSSSHHKHAPSSSMDDPNDDDDDDDDDDGSSSRVHSPEDLSMGGKMSRKHRKNYKNMTRERRVEANARERTRVHTISAAFDALRKAVPSYSYNQKLSKLAILRIASSYIMSLARLADLDYTSSSEHIQKPLTFAECVDMCTSTIQTEGRARRRH